MATILGLAPPKGTGTVSVSAAGANKLTAVTVDARTKLLSLDPDDDMRLQWVGVVGQAGDDTKSVKIRKGGPNEVDTPDWPNGPTFFLYSSNVATDCIVLAQRAKPRG